jgi:hypothetical protein
MAGSRPLIQPRPVAQRHPQGCRCYFKKTQRTHERSCPATRSAIPVQILRTRCAGSPVGPRMGSPRLWQCWFPGHRRAPGRRARVLHPAAAPQRDRHAAHGPCVQPDDHGQPHALPPHARLQHGLGARHRPRGHCHADRGGAPAAGARHQPPRHGPHPPRGTQEFCRQGVGVERAQRQHHHHADAPHGRQRGLEPRILHHGRKALQGGDRHLREAVSSRA